MKVVILLALVAFATAFPSFQPSNDVQSIIEDAKKAVMNNSQLDDQTKAALLELLNGPNAAQLVNENMPVFDFPLMRDAQLAEDVRCLPLVLLIQALIQSLTATTVAPTTAAAV